MKAKLAYLTTPAPGVFVLNFQVDASIGHCQYCDARRPTDEVYRIEISKAHLANILITGTDLALREQINSVFAGGKNESAA